MLQSSHLWYCSPFLTFSLDILHHCFYTMANLASSQCSSSTVKPLKGFLRIDDFKNLIEDNPDGLFQDVMPHLLSEGGTHRCPPEDLKTCVGHPLLCFDTWHPNTHSVSLQMELSADAPNVPMCIRSDMFDTLQSIHEAREEQAPAAVTGETQTVQPEPSNQTVHAERDHQSMPAQRGNPTIQTVIERLRFRNSAEAAAAITSARAKVVEDSSLPKTEADKLQWVAHVVAAMEDVSSATDNQKLVERWTSTVAANPALVEASAWALVVSNLSACLPTLLTSVQERVIAAQHFEGPLMALDKAKTGKVFGTFKEHMDAILGSLSVRLWCPSASSHQRLIDSRSKRPSASGSRSPTT